MTACEKLVCIKAFGLGRLYLTETAIQHKDQEQQQQQQNETSSLQLPEDCFEISQCTYMVFSGYRIRKITTFKFVWNKQRQVNKLSKTKRKEQKHPVSQMSWKLMALVRTRSNDKNSWEIRHMAP